MTFSPDITDDAVFAAVISFLAGVTGMDAAHIIQGQSNRTAPPPEPEYIVLNPLTRVPLAQPVETDNATLGTVAVSRSTQVGIMCDVHGDTSADDAQTIVTLFRSDYARTQFPTNIVPLDCSDPQQLQFETGEMQAENRWTFNLFLQITPTVSTPGQFASSLTLNKIVPADSGAS